MMNQQPRVWAESLLVAYVDGQLDAAQAQAVEAALRDDAEARAIVGVLRASGSAVKRAYDEALERPLPARLHELFADVPADPVTPSAEIVAFRPRRPALQRLLPLAAAIAALLIGFGAGYVSFGNRAGFTPAGEEPRGELYLAALQRALDMPGTGVDQDYADTAAGITGKVTVVGPVATANLGDCREFRHDAVSGSKTATSFGIACPGAAGSWVVEMEGPAGE
jgi:anti-sigma-K factor RskA